uniref:Uncharacterized protein n=1 Tax=viral metagenome TaxID=1070528 RepID=A0A6M3KYA5_9ZZZZ
MCFGMRCPYESRDGECMRGAGDPIDVSACEQDPEEERVEERAPKGSLP